MKKFTFIFAGLALLASAAFTSCEKTPAPSADEGTKSIALSINFGGVGTKANVDGELEDPYKAELVNPTALQIYFTDNAGIIKYAYSADAESSDDNKIIWDNLTNTTNGVFGIFGHEQKTFRSELEKIISEEGFTINHRKTRLQKANTRQEVTGLVVNKKVNVTKYYIHGIRNLLNIWEKYGYDEATKAFLPYYSKNKKHVKGKPDMRNVVWGKLQYIRMVKGSNNPVFLNLQKRFNLLADEIKTKSV